MNEIISTIKKLIEVRFNILRAEITDQISSVAARIAAVIIMLVFGSFILLFGSIALAFYFSEIYGSSSIGFLMLTGIYFLLFFLLFLLRNAEIFQGFLKNSISRYVFLFKERKD